MKSPTRWAVNSVPNLPTYTSRRVALLGDAVRTFYITSSRMVAHDLPFILLLHRLTQCAHIKLLVRGKRLKFVTASLWAV